MKRIAAGNDSVARPLPPRRTNITELSQAVGQWRLYQTGMQLPAPHNDRRFTCELLLRTDVVSLKYLAQFGDSLSQEEAWRTIARQGDSIELSGLTMLTGPAPIQWVEDCYWLYSPEQVKESVVYNSLSRFDAPDVAEWVERGLVDQRKRQIVTMILSRTLDGALVPLDQALVSSLDVIEAKEGVYIEQLIDSASLDYLSQVYNTEPSLPHRLMELLLLKRDNITVDPTHLFHARWVATYAPWLILRSERGLQEAFFEYYSCYRLLLLYGTNEEVKYLLGRSDPTRVRLATYIAPLPDDLDIVGTTVTDTALWDTT
jgi:hypothetical protein